MLPFLHSLLALIKFDDFHFDLDCSYVYIQIFFFLFIPSFCVSLPLALPKNVRKGIQIQENVRN